MYIWWYLETDMLEVFLRSISKLWTVKLFPTTNTIDFFRFYDARDLQEWSDSLL